MQQIPSPQNLQRINLVETNIDQALGIVTVARVCLRELDNPPPQDALGAAMLAAEDLLMAAQQAFDVLIRRPRVNQ
jgi:hypothetical protein